MKKTLAGCTLALALGTANLSHAQVYVHIGPPPPPVREVVPPPPHLGYVWQPGFHRWDGARYVWVPGTYAAGPRPGARWIPGHWRPTPRGYVWIEGHWR
jgi:hypothetical protein